MVGTVVAKKSQGLMLANGALEERVCGFLADVPTQGENSTSKEDLKFTGQVQPFQGGQTAREPKTSGVAYGSLVPALVSVNLEQNQVGGPPRDWTRFSCLWNSVFGASLLFRS